MAFRAPLLGYNTNVRHKGRLYHIQTEDSGVGHPHIITHLFADGGRIVGSKKTSYAEHLNAEGLQDTVKKLMQAQHKAMFIALRDGHYDETSPAEIPGETTGAVPLAEVEARASVREQGMDVQAAEAGARGTAAGSGERRTGDADKRPPLYQDTLPASGTSAANTQTSAASPSPAQARQSIFGSDLTSEKSLDEVILSYLATDEKD
jgi:hypothetical protein